MSDSDSNDDIKINFSRFIFRQPFIYVLLFAILASVVSLIYYDKAQHVDKVLEVGKYLVIVVAVSMVIGWIAPRLQMVLDSIPMMTEAYRRLAVSMESQSESQKVFAGFVQKVQHQIRANRMLLIIEDSKVDADIVRRWAMDIVVQYGMQIEIATSLREAYEHLAFACIAIADVALPDSDSADQINELIGMAGCPVIVYSGSNYSADDFPKAEAILKKGCSSSEFVSALRDAIKTRFHRLGLG